MTKVEGGKLNTNVGENQLPDGWVETTLGEVVTFQRGFDLPKKDRVSGKYPLMVSNGQDGTHRKYKVKGPGIVTGRSGSIGNVFYQEKDFWPLNTTLWIRDFKGNDIKFVYYFLKTFPFEKYNAGSGVPTLNRNHIHAVSVLISKEKKQQKAIAKMLSVFDDKIELLREQNETLEKIGQEIFKEWFGKYSIDDKLPDGWRVGKLGDICEITSGKRPKNKSDKKTNSHKIPLIGATKIMGYVEDFLYNEDILIIGRVGTHGEIQRFYSKIWPSDNTLVIKSEYFNFVYFILKNIDYEVMNRGAVQPLITQTDLKNYPVIFSKEKIGEFEKRVKSIFEKIKNNSEQIQTLSKTRDALLSKLMKGEIILSEK